MAGRRERVRRGGFATRAAAIVARTALLSRSREESTTELWTVARWLRFWLSTRTSIRPSTVRSYTEHVDNVLIPHLGSVRLGQLTGRHVAAMFTTLAATRNKWGRMPSPSTLHRMRATLRSALNAAIRDGLLRDNPARFIELPTPRRPQAQVWTEHRAREWRKTGERFSVAVWTAQLLAEFLKFVADDRLYAMWWLIALRGLRRGEAAGLRWVDVDLVRLHDLRHGAATLAHAAGADLKTVQEQLGHTSIVLTADTHTSVLMIMYFRVAEATARLVLAAAAGIDAVPVDHRRRPPR